MVAERPKNFGEPLAAMRVPQRTEDRDLQGRLVAVQQAAANVLEVRPEEQSLKFKVGDKVVYAAHGVTEVIAIEEKVAGGTREMFYVLQVLNASRKIFVPVKNADTVGLRPVMTEVQIAEIMEILREFPSVALTASETWNRRYRRLMAKIQTGLIHEAAEVARDLYRIKCNKQLSFGENRMLDQACGMICKEIAVARGQSEKEVRQQIEAIYFGQ